MMSYTISWLDERILSCLTTLRSARICGSFARGNPRDDSDLDVKVSDKDLQTFKVWLKTNGYTYTSELPGHIIVDGFELFTAFHPTEGRRKEVFINGRHFGTA